jgi:hypothetical protein
VRTIVMFTASDRINTGVWPSWGGSPPKEARLNWAAAGVTVLKSCPAQCVITHDNSALAEADAVLVEGVNWPKFGFAGQELPLPARSRRNSNARAGSAPGVPAQLPAVGYFGYEPLSYYPAYSLANKELAAKFDFTMTNEGATTLPITLVCPWGKPVEDYLAPAPRKGEGRLLAYFSEHGVAPQDAGFLRELFAAAGQGIHAYVHMRNRELPAEAGGDPFQLSTRLAFMGTYKFLLITEQVLEADFLSPEWSQAFLAGTVPVYLGAPNIAAYALPGGFVDARSFATGAELWAYLSSFAADGSGAVYEAYAQFFAWKAGAQRAAREDASVPPAVMGTGAGLHKEACSEEAVAAVKSWPRPPAVGSAPAPAQQDAALLEATAASAWRCFRRALDRCVHYAECRLCQHVRSIT